VELAFLSAQQLILCSQGAGALSAAFVGAMLSASAGKGDQELWDGLLRRAVAAVRERDFMDAAATGPALYALDILTQQKLLQRALVRRRFHH
jgi:hypothetical protein